MIRKSRILPLFVVISVVGFGQELPKQKTQEHRQVRGTNIFMIPPGSFEPSNNFRGFQNPKDQTSMIMIMDIPGPYSEVTKGFNSEMLKAKGMELKSREEIRVAEFSGLLIELTQPANGMVFSKHILIYGNEQATTMINGVCLKDSVMLLQHIRQSVLSTIVESAIKVNPRDALSYTLDEDAGSLKFKAVIGNGMLFNRDLKMPTESVDKATLVVERSFAKLEIENRKLFCISRIKKYPEDFSVIPAKGINEIEINNLKGFELFAKNNDQQNEEMYQIILFDDNGGYYLFVGTYVTGSENAISDIKKVIMTFKRKE